MDPNYTQKIAELDEKLTILREGWMDSKPEKKLHWQTKIDALLDERFKLMKLRDEQVKPLKHQI